MKKLSMKQILQAVFVGLVLVSLIELISINFVQHKYKFYDEVYGDTITVHNTDKYSAKAEAYRYANEDSYLKLLDN